MPKRGIGEKALKDLMELAEQQQVRTMEIIERAVKAPNPILGIRPGTIKSLKGFVEVVQEIRRMALAVSLSRSVETKAIPDTVF